MISEILGEPLFKLVRGHHVPACPDDGLRREHLRQPGPYEQQHQILPAAERRGGLQHQRDERKACARQQRRRDAPGSLNALQVTGRSGECPDVPPGPRRKATRLEVRRIDHVDLAPASRAAWNVRALGCPADGTRTPLPADTPDFLACPWYRRIGTCPYLQGLSHDRRDLVDVVSADRRRDKQGDLDRVG